MQLYILDQDYNKVNEVDEFESLIWTERYSAYGDFELHMNPGSNVLGDLKNDYYLKMTDSQTLMIIESSEISQSKGTVSYKVTGRSYESVLERRVVLVDFNNPPSAWEVIWASVYLMITQECPFERRRIPNLVADKIKPPGMEDRSGAEYEFKGKTLYELVKTISDDLGIGFRIDTSDPNRNQFITYLGTDRSWSGNAVPVIFSNDLGNLSSMNYVSSLSNYVNYLFMDLYPSKSDGPNYSRYLESSEPGGIRRRESYLDISSLTKWGDAMDSYVQKQAQLAAYQTLMSKQPLFMFDASIDSTKGPFYGTDYFLGDIVEIESTYPGVSKKYKVVEFIWSYSPTGVSMYPTFKAV